MMLLFLHPHNKQMDLLILPSLIICLILPLILFFLTKSRNQSELPMSFPIIGSFFTILKNEERFTQWTSDILSSTRNLTFTLRRPFGVRAVFTANPAVVEHILKSHFHNYEKGDFFKINLRDFLGDGIFNTDGENWKFQRQVSSHEFNTKSLRKFVSTVVDHEISNRLVPILETVAADKSVVDFQDILQRFAFDNICNIAFGYDPAYLSPSLPQEELAVAFDKAVYLSTERFRSFIPYSWKIKKALNIGSEKELKLAVNQVREFAKKLINEKRGKSEQNDEDLLSRFLNSGHSDEAFVTDIVVSFMLAGRDTTSAALTWFFWLLSSHPQVENTILEEIRTKPISAASAYDEVKEMVYIHASLCESMRLYPPVPVDSKAALSDDVLPDGTVVKKGMRVGYHPYAMGRVEKVWGEDWAEFRPNRWLKVDDATGKLSFMNKDSYTYPVFQAGPRICLGKEMAFIQMKRVVASVLRQFRVIPVAAEEGAEPMYVQNLTAKMKNGFPVRIELRE